MPLPSDVSVELYAFQKHFILTLIFASMNVFCDLETISSPHGWKEKCFQTYVCRIPNSSDATPSWARFQLLTASLCLIEAITPIGSNDEILAARRESRAQFTKGMLEKGMGFMDLSDIHS